MLINTCRWAGVDSALRLLHKLNRSDIPVAFQEGYLGSTRLNLDYPSGMPPSEWTEANNRYLEQWIGLEPSQKPAAWQSAPQLICQILQSADLQSVFILELGPYTNLAAALHRSDCAALFRSKVQGLYVQGGRLHGDDAQKIQQSGGDQTVMDEESCTAYRALIISYVSLSHKLTHPALPS